MSYGKDFERTYTYIIFKIALPILFSFKLAHIKAFYNKLCK